MDQECASQQEQKLKTAKQQQESVYCYIRGLKKTPSNRLGTKTPSAVVKMQVTRLTPRHSKLVRAGLEGPKNGCRRMPI